MSAALPIFEQLQTVTKPLPFESGQVFYHQGDASTGLFYIEAGYIKLYRHSTKKIQILALLSTGDTFGAESFSDQGPCPWSAEAVTPGEVSYLEPEALQKGLAEHPELLVALLELVWQRLRQFTILVHGLAFRDVRARLADVLLKLATIEGTSTAEGICVRQVLSQQELASMVGTAREVVNRTLKKLEQDNLLRVRPAEIIILDVKGLERIAAEETR